MCCKKMKSKYRELNKDVEQIRTITDLSSWDEEADDRVIRHNCGYQEWSKTSRYSIK